MLSTRGYEIRPSIYNDSARRIVRAGVMPSAAAAACKDVVLKGAGGRVVRDFSSISSTIAECALRTRLNAAVACSLSLKRAIACVVLNFSSALASGVTDNMPEITQ